MTASVSLFKYTTSPDSMRQAVTACRGLDRLNRSDRVLIKPNLVAWDDTYPMAPYGVYTTTRLVEDLIICLKESGCSHIVIGEGSVQIKKGVGTMAAFEGLGYRALEKRYGIRLIDFNESPCKTVQFAGGELDIAAEALETDFFINFPVLKTHGQTKVSLGIKNLKGCLKLKSKRFCHNPGSLLELAFSHIADFINPSLTLIDGIYALERGALHFGNAYRKDLIIASTDILGADLIGAAVMGYTGEEIGHFLYYAGRHEKSMAMEDYRIEGERLNDHVQPLKWDWTWTKDNTGPGIFAKMGITGTALPKYDETLCSGCSPLANMINLLVLSAFNGKPLPSIEILNGKKMEPRPGYEKTVLLGNCMIKANRNHVNINKAIPVKGCPPAEPDVVSALKIAGLDVKTNVYHDYMKQQSEKYTGREGFDPVFFSA
jgi:uncharacterized protein (DUF362 family)